MANIEAGHIWNGHETLSQLTYIPTSGAAGQFDRHATWVGMVMGGRLGGANPGEYQRGMAPNAQLASGAIATSWPAGNSQLSALHNGVLRRLLRQSRRTAPTGPRSSAACRRTPARGGPMSSIRAGSAATGSNELAGTDNLERHARRAHQREPAHALHRGRRQLVADRRGPEPRSQRPPALTTT